MMTRTPKWSAEMLIALCSGAVNAFPLIFGGEIVKLPPTCRIIESTVGQFIMANQLNLHIFGLWEETGAPGGNPRRHGENVQTPHRQ